MLKCNRFRILQAHMTVITPETLLNMIQQSLPDATVEVSSPDNIHFSATICSPKFMGKSRIEQHRLVYAALGSHMDQAIHALQIKTSTPEDPK